MLASSSTCFSTLGKVVSFVMSNKKHLLATPTYTAEMVNLRNRWLIEYKLLDLPIRGPSFFVGTYLHSPRQLLTQDWHLTTHLPQDFLATISFLLLSLVELWWTDWKGEFIHQTLWVAFLCMAEMRVRGAEFRVKRSQKLHWNVGCWYSSFKFI